MRNATKREDDLDLNGGEPEPSDSSSPEGATRRLLDPTDAGAFREQWKGLQNGFVDEPRRSVEQADYLVDLVLSKLTEDLRGERDQLVRRWDRGGEDVSTEDLRQALRGYRTLLERLLTL